MRKISRIRKKTNREVPQKKIENRRQRMVKEKVEEKGKTRRNGRNKRRKGR